MSVEHREHRNQADQARTQHRDAWLIVLVVGFAIIVAGNLIDFVGAWWIALAVSAAMVGFAYVIFDSPVSGDTKGDSIYYLGLLFTFAALVAALISFDWSTTGTDATGTAGAIRNFGIALLTTIVGLAGRVWFTMSQESPGDVADTAKLTLENAVSEMERSLNRARDDLDVLAKRLGDSAEGMGKTAAVIASGTDMAATTAKTLEKLGDGVAGMTASFTAEMQGFVPVVRESAAAASSFAKSLGNIETTVDGLGNYLKNAGSTLHLSFSALDDDAKAAARAIPGFREGIETASSKAVALDAIFGELENSAESAITAFAKLAKHTEGARLRQVLALTAQEARAMSDSLRNIGGKTEALDREIDRLVQATAGSRRALVHLTDTSQSVGEEIRDAGGDLAVQVNGVREHTNTLNGSLDALGHETVESTRALDEFRDQIRALEQVMSSTRQLGIKAGRRETRIARFVRSTVGVTHKILRFLGHLVGRQFRHRR